MFEGMSRDYRSDILARYRLIELAIVFMTLVIGVAVVVSWL
jgi:hypothetical protein